MDKDRLLFVDAETDGLFGPFLSVAVIVTDMEGIEIEQAYFGIDPKKITVKNEWTKVHVLPRLGSFEPCTDETDLLKRVWNVWSKYKDRAYLVGDVIYPVETRLFEACTECMGVAFQYEGPFPFLDLAGMLFAKGIDPLSERSILAELSPEGQHNALFDAQTSVKIYKKWIRKGVLH